MKFLEINALFRKRMQAREPKIIEVDEYDDITDEIEKSLIQIRNVMNLSEEEVSTAIKSRRAARERLPNKNR